MHRDLGPEWVKARKKPVVVEVRDSAPGEVIETLEGTMVGGKGTYIIRGISGEEYPIQREIFWKTYELCDE